MFCTFFFHRRNRVIGRVSRSRRGSGLYAAAAGVSGGLGWGCHSSDLNQTWVFSVLLHTVAIYQWHGIVENMLCWYRAGLIAFIHYSSSTGNKELVMGGYVSWRGKRKQNVIPRFWKTENSRWAKRWFWEFYECLRYILIKLSVHDVRNSVYSYNFWKMYRFFWIRSVRYLFTIGIYETTIM